jgi:hypothetical protein
MISIFIQKFKLWPSAEYFHKNSTTVQPSILVHNSLPSELHISTFYYIYMLNVTIAQKCFSL